MKILLIGEYSRLHLSLSEGLKSLGYSVTLMSDGDGFKDYARDVDIKRAKSGISGSASDYCSIIRKVRQNYDFDVVQIINPGFTTLNIRINAILFDILRKKNKKVFFGAFGDDSYWLRACLDNRTFRYSEFYVEGNEQKSGNHDSLRKMWLNSPHERATKKMANKADGIVACLYEYYEAYKTCFHDKLRYIPLPVNISYIEPDILLEEPDVVKFFIGINRDKNRIKGTDIMYRALRRLHDKYPDKTEVIKVESLSYDVYQKRMREAHVVLDQLYSYTPAMNALLAMAMGKIAVGGGEKEMYELLGETANFPVINVLPTEDDVFRKLEFLVLNKELLPALSRKGRAFVEKHHNHVDVARQYLDFWNA